MPTVEVPLSGDGYNVHHVEPHRVITAADFNQLSGDQIPGSWMEQLIGVVRMMLNKTSSEPAYLGFKVQSFSGTGPQTSIETARGTVVDWSGIWPVPDLTLKPTPEAHYGHFEFSLEESLEDKRTKQFYSIDREEIDNVLTPVSKRRHIRLYEVYDVSPTMTPTTPGRIRWFEYRKAAAFQQIASIRNFLTAGSTNAGLGTGAVVYSLKPGDGIDWLTCDGSQVPIHLQDLINFLRSVATHPSPLAIEEVSDDGSGLCRLRLPNSVNLKNIQPFPGERYNCLEVIASDNPTAFPPGTYKIRSIRGNMVVIGLSYAGGQYSGTASIRPYSIADEDGGGARTPLPAFVRPYINEAQPDDLHRLPNTYQSGQIAQHDHAGATEAGGAHTHPLSDPGHSHTSFDWHHHLSGQPGLESGVGEGRRLQQFATSADTTGISIVGAADHTHPINKAGGEDPDNPTETRPNNISLYLLMKT